MGRGGGRCAGKGHVPGCAAGCRALHRSPTTLLGCSAAGPHCSPQPQSWDGIRPLCTWNVLWVQVGTGTLRPWLEQQHCTSSSERAKGISSN